MNCLQRMEQKSALFTKTDKIIADYIKENRESVLSLSIVELGDKTNTSPAAIIRFNKKLDYKNFNDFKLDLLRAFGDNIGNAQKFVISRVGAIEEITEKLYAIPDKSIRDTIDLINFQVLKDAIFTLVKAKNIFLCAVDSSSMAARDFYQKVLRLQRCVMFSENSYMQTEYCKMATKDDVLVAFSYSGTEKDTELCIKSAKKNGAKIICITRSDNNEFLKLGDYNFFVPVMKDDFNEIRVGYAQTVLIDILYMGMSNAFEITDEMIAELKHTQHISEAKKYSKTEEKMETSTIFKPRVYNTESNRVYFSGKPVISGAQDSFVQSLAERIAEKANCGQTECASVIIENTIPQSIKEKLAEKYIENEEGFVIEIGAETKIYGESRNAVIYALSTIEQLYDNNNLYCGFLYDCPDKEIRGYKVYTPDEDHIEDFKRIADMLVYYRYNTVMLEIGGAMEYKRRPEINEAWIKFCSQFKGRSSETLKVQMYTYPWQKNSIHVDNGSGGFITQERMSELAEYCRERGLKIIPEVPTLSHSDYIVAAYPELNERKEDKHPDTYCPSNPKSYEVVFDVIDEVCEVFKPEYINIGHDELYSIGVCERCCDKSPVDLYVGDITKIRDYLKKKGVKTIMWCEKLFNAFDKYGAPEGGADRKDGYTPALYECAGKIPKDVIMLHWYSSLVSMDEEERVIRDNGYKMLYGNFSAIDKDEYRRGMGHSMGAVTSNWGSLEDEYMQRNFQYLNIVSCAAALWSDKYDDGDRDDLRQLSKKELYRRHCEESGKNRIEIIHTTDEHIDYKVFYDGVFIEDEIYLMGYYNVIYSDGTRAQLPVKYGYNISDKTAEENCSLYREVQGAAYPMELDGYMYYKTCYKNPYPEKRISGVYFEALPGKNSEVIVKEINFA